MDNRRVRRGSDLPSRPREAARREYVRRVSRVMDHVRINLACKVDRKFGKAGDGGSWHDSPTMTGKFAMQER